MGANLSLTALIGFSAGKEGMVAWKVTVISKPRESKQCEKFYITRQEAQ